MRHSSDNEQKEEISQLVKRIQENDSTLTTVDLSDSRVDDDGAILIASALTDNTFVEDINLSGTYVSTAGVVAIAVALRKNNWVQYLGLANIDFGNEGCEALIKTLQFNTSLLTIHLSDNGISSPTLEEQMNSLIKRNREALQKWMVSFGHTSLDKIQEEQAVARINVNSAVTYKLQGNYSYGGHTVLTWAIDNIRDDIVKWLLTFPNISVTTPSGYIPREPWFDAKNKSNKTPLEFVIYRGHGAAELLRSFIDIYHARGIPIPKDIQPQIEKNLQPLEKVTTALGSNSVLSKMPQPQVLDHVEKAEEEKKRTCCVIL